MRDMLNELYNGRIYPSEQYVPHSYQYAAMTQTYYDCRTALEKKLTPELSQELDLVFQKYQDLISEELYEMFQRGYRLGSRLMLEIMYGDEG